MPTTLSCTFAIREAGINGKNDLAVMSFETYIARGGGIKGNVAVCKDLNLEFVTKNSLCHELADKKFRH